MTIGRRRSEVTRAIAETHTTAFCSRAGAAASAAPLLPSAWRAAAALTRTRGVLSNTIGVNLEAHPRATFQNTASKGDLDAATHCFVLPVTATRAPVFSIPPTNGE